MIDIKLSREEFEYLINSSFLSEKRNSFMCSVTSGSYHTLSISEKEVDELRDLFGQQLQLWGFDKEYNLTQEGEILESLIDKFYSG